MSEEQTPITPSDPTTTPVPTQPESIGTELQNIVHIAENDLAALAEHLRPIVADEINKALPGLQQQVQPLLDSLKHELLTQVGQHHEGLLHVIANMFHSGSTQQQ